MLADRHCVGVGWCRALWLAAIVGAVFPAVASAHETAALTWEWSAVEVDDNADLIDFLDTNNGQVVELLLEIPGASGSGSFELYEECVPERRENERITELPLTAVETVGENAVECGNMLLRIEGEEHVSRYESLYPTYVSEVIAGSFRVIRLEEWADAASQTVVFVIEGQAR